MSPINRGIKTIEQGMQVILGVTLAYALGRWWLMHTAPSHAIIGWGGLFAIGMALAFCLTAASWTSWALWRHRSKRIAVLAEHLGRATPWHILSLAFVLRVLFVLAADVHPVSDYAEFHLMAFRTLQTGQLFFETKPAGAALLMALVYTLTGPSVVAFQLFQACLGSIEAVVIYRLSSSIFPGIRWAAAAAGLLFAVWPSQIAYTVLTGSDIPFSLAILLAVSVLARWQANPSRWILVGCGIMLGAAQYIRTEGVLFLGASMVLVLVVNLADDDLPASRKAGRLSKDAVALVVPFVLAISPFVLYWRANLGLITLSSGPLQQGMVLLAGTTPTQDPELASQAVKAVSATTDSTSDHTSARQQALLIDRAARQLAIERIRSNPLRQLWLGLFYLIPRFWGGEPPLAWIGDGSRITPRMATGIAYSFNIVRIPLVVTAAAFLLLRRKTVDIPGVISSCYIPAALLYTGTHIFLESQARYNFVFIPLLILLCVGYVANLTEHPAVVTN